MTTTTSIQKADDKPRFILTPQSLDEALRFADMLSQSSMVPKDYQGNPANCVIAMQWGLEIGLQPLQAMQNIAVINGRPSIWGDAMLAIVRGSGLLEYIREDPTDSGCTCVVKRLGEDEVTRTYTAEDAKRAGLLGKQGPWQHSPKRMMQMRARAFALRDIFPDVLRGVHIAEIAQDEPEEKDMGAAEVVASKPKSRATAARAALSDKRGAAEQATVPAVTLDGVLAAILAADTQDALGEAGAMAAQLSDADKEQARTAYKKKADAIRRQEEAAAEAAETDDFIAAIEAAEAEEQQ